MNASSKIVGSNGASVKTSPPVSGSHQQQSQESHNTKSCTPMSSFGSDSSLIGTALSSLPAARKLFSTSSSPSLANKAHNTNQESIFSFLPPKIQKNLEPMEAKLDKLQGKFPVVQNAVAFINALPVWVKMGYVAFWIAAKIFLAFFVLHQVAAVATNKRNNGATTTTNKNALKVTPMHAHQQHIENSAAGNFPLDRENLHHPKRVNDTSSSASFGEHLGGGRGEEQKTKVLYIVTTLAEYNTGSRQTVKGQDRLQNILLPVLVDNVESMIAPPYNYHVDVFFISAYELLPERREMIEQLLPHGVGFEVWDDACPLGYDNKQKKGDTNILDNTRSLSRQHRYVVKDKLFYYNLFLAFEDDMRVTGEHVEHYLHMTNEIEILRTRSTNPPEDPDNNMDSYQMKFFGEMSQQQLNRLIPGFLRVEVLVDESQYPAQTKLDPIALDYQFDDYYQNDEKKAVAAVDAEKHFDPKVCCYIPTVAKNFNSGDTAAVPRNPKSSDVIIWESNARGLAVRKMPGEFSDEKNNKFMEWIALLSGPGKRIDKKHLVGGYWSGRNGAYGKDAKKPNGGEPTVIGQQGGWMLTREQIIRLNDRSDKKNALCMGAFLPPYSKPQYLQDGQHFRNVEFWSGSYQLFTGITAGCNMQRVVSLHPDYYSKHFIYHMANNKQKQLTSTRMVRADHLFGQLNTVRKIAAKEERDYRHQRR